MERAWSNLGLLSLLGVVAACHPPTPAECVAASTTLTSAHPLDDGQEAEILRAALAELVDQADLAAQRASEPRVTKLALELSRDYHSRLAGLIDLRRALDLRLTRTPVSQDISDDSRAKMHVLMVERQANFDVAYVDSEIDVQRAVLRLIDSTLLPNVEDARLRDSLLGLRRVVALHAEQAENVQAAMVADALTRASDTH
jgi:predicted outer membrane protein